MTTNQKLFQRQYKDLFAYVYRYVRWRITDPDTTADLVSSIFLLAYEKLEQFDPERGHLQQWITGIMRNQLAEHWRKHRLTISLDAMTEGWLGSIEQLITQPNLEQLDRQQLVNSIIDQLPDETRKLVILHYVDGLNYAEIAHLTDKQPATVRQFFSRLQRKLAQEFQHLHITNAF